MTASATMVPTIKGVPPAPANANVHSRERGGAPAGAPPAPPPGAPGVYTPPAAPAASVPEVVVPPTVQGAPEAPVTVVPPTAPVAPVVPEQTAQPQEQPQNQPAVTGGYNDFDVNSIEDPSLKAVAGVFKSMAVPKGLDIQRAVGTAIDESNVAFIDLPYLREKLGPDADHAYEIAKQIVNMAAAQGERTVAAVHSSAGGEANWNAAVAVLNQSAPQYLRETVAELLNSGSPTKIQNGAKMVVDFAQANGSLVQSGNRVNAVAGATAQPSGIGAAEFKHALTKLDRNSPTYEQDRNLLYWRRQEGKNASIR